MTGEESRYPLTPLQHGMLVHHVLEPQSGVDVEQLVCTLAEAIDPVALQRAWARVSDRHPVLRTAIAWDDPAGAQQVVIEAPPFDWQELDWRASEPARQDERRNRWLVADRERGFDLRVAPLQRVTLIRVADQSWDLVWTFHHIILDGRSFPIVLREVFAAYDAELGGPLPAWTPPPPFERYARWVAAKDTTAAEAFWRERLRGFAAPTPLPANVGDAPAFAGTRQASTECLLPEEITAALAALADRHGVTMNTVAQAAWAILLARHGGEPDVVFGATRAARKDSVAGAEEMVGLLINTVPLRLRVDPAASLGDLLATVRAEWVALRAVEHAPLHRVQGWSELPSGMPLFDTLLVFESYLLERKLRSTNAAWERRRVVLHEQTNYAMLVAVYGGERLTIKLEYDPVRIASGTAERLLDQYGRLLAGMAAEPDARVGDLPWLSPAERERVVRDWNATARAYPDGEVLHALIAAQAAATPEAVAVVCDGRTLSYRELEDRASTLARALVVAGVRPGVLVGVCLERSLDLVVSLLGVLKAGGAYVPLDPEYPPERVAYMVADAQCPVLLTHAPVAAALAAALAREGAVAEGAAPPVVMHVDTDWARLVQQAAQAGPLPTATPDDLAYMIYTSGSTGRPKGAMNRHRGIVNRLRWMQDEYQLTAADVVLQKTPASFDVSVWEFFWPLLAGARLVLAEPGGHRDPAYLARVMRDERVTVMHFVPSMLRAFLDSGVATSESTLRDVMCSGEALPHDLQERFFDVFPTTGLHNLYGPTEAAVDVTYWSCRRHDPRPVVPIGRPVANTQVYVLDPAMRPVPIGVPGELYLGGVQVGAGYHRRPELTAERFVPDPFASDPAARLYRTGDRARWLSDGTVEYTGRLDFQIKLRGFRIEIGEIEAALLAIPSIRDCAVVLRTDASTEPRLVAYHVLADGARTSAAELRALLAETLPSHMVPSVFVPLDAMPLSPAGKLDRRALPAPPSADGTARAETFVAPETETERTLARIWEEVLRVERVGVHDNFFELGGDSILMIQVVSRARKAGLVLSPADLFKHPTVAELAARTRVVAVAEAAAPAELPGAVRVNPAVLAQVRQAGQQVLDAYALSPMQQGLLFHELAATARGEYHIQTCFDVRGTLHVAEFRRAWDEVVRRHPILRTAFVWEGSPEPLQVVLDTAPLPFVEVDWRGLTAVEGEARFAQLLADDRRAGFDLARAPLTRVTLIRTGDAAFRVLWSVHHLLLDGWSSHALLKEVYDAYRANCTGVVVPYDALRPYRDYIDELQRRPASSESAWRERLAGFDAPTPLGVDHRAVASMAGSGQEAHRLTTAATAALQAFARQHRVTLSTVLQGAWAFVLSRYSGQDDVLFGVTMTTRPATLLGVERMVGLFLNTLPVRVRVSRDAVAPWLQGLQLAQAELRAHENTPLADIQRWSEVARGTALFDSLLVFENYPGATPFAEALEDATFENLQFIEQTHYPLTLVMVPGDRLEMRAMYDTARLDADAVVRLLGHLDAVLASFAAGNRTLADVTLLGDDERRRVVRDWNATARAYPDGEVLHALIAAQAAATPEAAAVVCDGRTLSYRDLEDRASTLARALVVAGVGPGVLVGVCLERSLDLVVSLLGVLKAGGAYVPLDPEYPAERVAYMVADAQCPVLLTHAPVAAALAAALAREGAVAEGTVPPMVLHVDTDWARLVQQAAQAGPLPTATPDDLAYMIYTSGSTGRPKGAMNRHRGIVNRLRWMQDEYQLTAADVVLQKTPASFDVSVWEFFWPLLAGARLVLAEPGGHRDPAYLARVMRDERVTVMHFVPSMLRAFLDSGVATSESTLRDVMCSGEALPHDLQERFFDVFPTTGLHNLYGPTEAAVDVTYWSCRRHDPRPVVPIGRPVANTQVYVLDPAMRPVPIGVPGELYLGGVQVGAGYHRRPELTAERFVPDPFASDPAARLYRTGDRARWLSDGTVEYTGRLDFQIKLRGFRIEIGEIEAALLAIPSIRDCAVVLRTDASTEPRLVAYHVLADGARTSAAELRAVLAETLPSHMVPSVFVPLDAMPLSPAGKLDRRALPAPPSADGTARAETFVAPETETERTLARIWEEVLRVERVGVHDNFFELGGDSILSIQIAARARDAGLPLTVGTLVKHATVAEVAASLAGATLPVRATARARTALRDVPLTPIQRWFFEGDIPERSHWNQTFLFRTSMALDEPALARAIDDLVGQHEALRTRFTLADGVWRPRVADAGEDTPLWVEDLSALGDEALSAAITAVSEQAARSLDIGAGPCLRVVYCRLGEGRGARLLLTVHHLVVDGVSWRILREDLESAYGSHLAGAPVRLPARTASFEEWAVALADRASQPDLDAELPFWVATTAAPLGRLPAGTQEAAANLVGNARTFAVSLEPGETQDLLQRVPAAYATQVNDVLIAALESALASWAGAGALLLDLEGHGREEIGASLDLTRTVGWFTSIFPVRLELDERADIATRLKAVKERLRAVPRRGIGYGLLRYLREAPALAQAPAADVLFNYLGQFDQLVADSKLLAFAPESEGAWVSASAVRRHLLDINALVINGRLECRWTHASAVHDEVTVRRVADAMLATLRAIIAHCREPGAGGRTPSDFPLVALSQGQVDRLVGDGKAVDDLGPLAPMQALFLATSVGGSHDVGFDQWRYELDGDLDVGALRRAWQFVAGRHQILRTSFATSGLDAPVQVIRRQVDVPFLELDWRAADAPAQREAWKTLLEDDRARGFRVDEAPLLRLTLVRTGERAWTLLWSNHHLLLDRWSWPIVLREVGVAYQAHKAGRRVELPPPTPWRRYIAWLTEQRPELDETFWRAELSGLTAAPLRPLRGAGEAGGERLLELSASTTARLMALARERRVTLNTLVTTAWALWLSHATGRDDVVCGLVVAGRPDVVPGIERLVGMCINNLPLRLQVDPAAPLPALVARVVERQQASAAHGHASLIDVQQWSGLPWRQRVFDTLLVFQHSGADAEGEGWLGDTPSVRMRSGEMHTNYPLTLVVGGREALTLRLAYHGRAADAESAAAVLASLQELLTAMVDAPDAVVGELLHRIEPVAFAEAADRVGRPRVPPATDTEWVLARIWTELLGRDEIGVDDSFFDLGGQSLVATQVMSRVRDTFRMELPVALVFEQPTVRSMGRALIEREASRGQVERIAQLVRRVEEMSVHELREAGVHG